jgi:hypothetical protein
MRSKCCCRSQRWPVAYGTVAGAGICLGLYCSLGERLGFVFILAVWLVLTAVLAPAQASVGRFTAIMAAIALAIVLVFQDRISFATTRRSPR